MEVSKDRAVVLLPFETVQVREDDLDHPEIKSYISKGVLVNGT